MFIQLSMKKALCQWHSHSECIIDAKANQNHFSHILDVENTHVKMWKM